MASKKRSDSWAHHSPELPQNPTDSPGSRYHTAQNTPDVHWDNNNNSGSNSSSNHHHRQEEQQAEVAVPAVAAAVLKRETAVRVMTELGLRMTEVVFCLVSAWIMATDRTQGWAGDSFDRYKEYRYCLTVNVIGCVYSGIQACEKAYQVVSAKNKRQFSTNVRSLFDYLMDQLVAYLLVSASSSAATRVKDWESNWGKDKFTEKASASIVMAFLAFISFAISSLFSFFKLGASFLSSS